MADQTTSIDLSNRKNRDVGILTVIFVVLLVLAFHSLSIIVLSSLFFMILGGGFAASIIESIKLAVVAPEEFTVGARYLIFIAHAFTILFSLTLILLAYKHYSRKLFVSFVVTLILAIPATFTLESVVFASVFGGFSTLSIDNSDDAKRERLRSQRVHIHKNR